MKRHTLILAFVWLVCHIQVAHAQDAKAVQPVKVGALAPDFDLEGMQPKKTVKLSDYRAGSKDMKKADKNVVVVFVRAHW